MGSKGNEFEAVVEFAPNQKISGVKEGRRKDVKMGTIEQDADYLKFLEALESEGPGSGLTVAQNLEEIEEKERLKKSGVTETTPLLQFFKENKEEKLKKREEMKSNKRRKEEERRKLRDEERQLRREKKEKEIRENEKRKGEKRNANIEEDIKSRQRDRKDRKERDKKESQEADSGSKLGRNRGKGEAEEKWSYRNNPFTAILQRKQRRETEET